MSRRPLLPRQSQQFNDSSSLAQQSVRPSLTRNSQAISSRNVNSSISSQFPANTTAANSGQASNGKSSTGRFGNLHFIVDFLTTKCCDGCKQVFATSFVFFRFGR